MAIDDNTIYGLYGSQIKDLPEKINAVKGKAKELTSADYDWPTGNPDGVALWNLDNGVYTRSSSVKVYYSTSGTISASTYPSFLSLQTPYSAYAYCTGDELSHPRLYYTHNKTTHGGGSTTFLTSDIIVTNLTTDNNDRVLAASQGKALKDLVDSLAIRGAGAPTTSTVGTVGKLYEDTTNGKLYICTDATNPYVWEEVGAGGGGPTVVQTTGTSTTDVMSQNATTSMIFADPATQKRVKIGAFSNGSDGSVVIGLNAIGGSSSTSDVVIGADAYAGNGNRNIVIGASAKTGSNSSHSIAIGASAEVDSTARGAIALGPGAHATVSGTMDIGASLMTDRGYNNTVYRLLTGLYDPQSAHDAATKGYVDTAVAGAGTSAFTTNEWNALWA